MWMPPGQHTINASRGGKPHTLTMQVNPEHAHLVNSRLQEMRAAADAGTGDRPFLDFNHDDREASGHPTEAFWGGEDGGTGGIRLKVGWTGAGARAIRGREFSRFSPSFYSDESGNVVNVPVNLGGLVNRAAFQRIAPIMSKRAEADALTSAVDFLTKAKAIARARNLSDAGAFEFVAKSDPYLYDCYRWDLYGGGGQPPKKPDQIPYFQTAAYRNEFCLRARALADAIGVSEAKAIDVLAHEQPALYLRYRAQIGLGDSRRVAEEIADVQARTVDSAFFTLAKRIAAQRSIDLADAFPIAASAHPELADHYQGRL
jgi:hypothetical protein